MEGGKEIDLASCAAKKKKVRLSVKGDRCNSGLKRTGHTIQRAVIDLPLPQGGCVHIG